MSTDKIEKLWEEFHATNNRWMLTGSNPNNVYRLHNINVGENERVLEIGVGLGDSIRYIAQKNSVIAVDIAQNALDKVKNVADVCLTPDMVSIPDRSIDWALCHLVMQHCDEDMVRFMITEVVKKLKPRGFFSFQFAHLPDANIEMNKTYKECIANGIMHFRSMEAMANIISEGRGRILNIQDPIVYPNEFNITWYIVKVGARI